MGLRTSLLQTVTIITITTLLITASLSLTSSIDDEELELYCENGCFASASIWFLLYLSTWSSGYGFLISFTLLIAFKSKNILPSDLETGNLFFEQCRHETYFSYILAYVSMITLFGATAFYYLYEYKSLSMEIMNWCGVAALITSPSYIIYQFYFSFEEKIHELNLQLGTEKIRDFLEQAGCPQYQKRFVTSKISFGQLQSLSVDDLVNYLNIPVGDAKRIVDSFSQAEEDHQ